MKSFKTPFCIDNIEDGPIKNFIASRLAEIKSTNDEWAENYGSFLIVEPGDTMESLKIAASWPLFQGNASPELPTFEWVNSYGDLYEIAYIISDSGQYIIVVVPMNSNIDYSILMFCRNYLSPLSP